MNDQGDLVARLQRARPPSSTRQVFGTGHLDAPFFIGAIVGPGEQLNEYVRIGPTEILDHAMQL